MQFCLTGPFTGGITKWAGAETGPLHFHLSFASTSLKMITLWPLYFLIFLKILSFLPTADRQKFLFLSYLMSEFFRLFLIPTWEIFWHCVLFFRYWCLFGLAQRLIWEVLSFISYVILCLFSSFSLCPSLSVFFFWSKMCCFTSFAVYALFPNKSATIFSLRVLCSALNHDLPVCVSWGISVSDCCLWHLFSKLWKYFREEDNTSGKSDVNVPPSPWVPGVLWSTRCDSSVTGSWLCRLLLFMAVATLHIYWERTVLMEISCP